jgi:anti-sigma regulatory factor (Ser/Thr protein kinase)
VTAVLDQEVRLDNPTPDAAATRRFRRDTHAPRAARNFVTDTLTGIRADTDTIDTAVLLISELVTNAVKHPDRGQHVTVALYRDDHKSIRFEVTDSGRRPIPPANGLPTADGYSDPDADDGIGGLGLTILGILAAAHGVRRIPGGNGNIAWFLLAIDPGRQT